jgi:competence protein ComEC
MPFPLFFIALSFIFGLWLSEFASLPLPPAIAGLAASLVLAWIFFGLKKPRACLSLLFVASAFLGAGRFAHMNHRFDANGLHRLPAGNEYADFSGTLVRSPSPGLDRDYLYLRVEKMSAAGQETSLSGNLRISIPRSAETAGLPEIFAGDRLKIAAQVSPAREFRNFNEPFARMYLKTQLLHNLATTKSALLVEKTRSGPGFSVVRLMSILRLRCQRKIERYFPSKTDPRQLTSEGAVLETLLLGGRGRLRPETTQALQKTGLFHLFAISGAHIGIISFFLFGLFRLVRLPTRVSYALLIVLLVFYALLVEGRASVVRAVVMSIAFLLGKLFWKDAHLLNTIGLSALVILLFNPFQLFDLGFQLTFAATLAIILFYPKIFPVMPRLPLKLSEMFTLSLAAQMGVFPLIALSFHRIIFSGLILNMIGIPLVSVIMAVGYVFLPASFIPFLGRPFAAVLTFLIKFFMASTRLLDGASFLSYRIPTPKAWVVIGYAVFLLLWLLAAKTRIFKVAFSGGFIAFFVVLIIYPFPSSSKTLKVTFLDVGQGDAILVEFPGPKKMLVDAGGAPTGTFDFGENVVSPFLWSKGIKKIDFLVLTHAHPDHLNGLVSVARNFRIGEFWEVISPPADPKYDELKTALGAVPQRRVFRGFSRNEGGVRIDVLFPPEAAAPVAAPDNNRSLVLKVRYGSASFLLTSDIGIEAEQAILDAGDDVRSNVFKSPHHGSSSSSSDAILRAVAPEIIVIPVGSGNRYGFPSPGVLSRYEKSGARIFRTDFHGAVEFSTDGTSLAVRISAGDDLTDVPRSAILLLEK